MNRYAYNGPVMEFSRCVQDHFKAETIAATPEKAKSNLAYQWKKKSNRVSGSRVSLPGTLILLERR